MKKENEESFESIFLIKCLHNEMLKPFYKKYGYARPDSDTSQSINNLFTRVAYDCENPIEEYKKFYKFYEEEFPDLDLDKLWVKAKENVKLWHEEKTKNVEGKHEDIKTKVIYLLAAHKKNEASEEIVKFLLEHYHFFSIRNNIAPEIWVYQKGIYKDIGISIIKETCRDILLDAYTTHFCNNIIAKIEADSFIDAKDFFKDKEVNFVPVENGIVDIENNKLLPFTHEKIFFNKLPIKYDKDARCKNIIKHFKLVLKNKDDIKTMQELFGDLLRKEYRYEKSVMLNGYGRNGKSKTLTLIKAFLGPDNCSSISLEQLETDQYAVGNLFGKMANLASDLSKTVLKKTGLFRNCVGRDMITANRKNKTHINFVNYAKMFFACNELPITYDTTDGFWSKWIYFDFPYKFVDKEEYEQLKDKKMFRIKDENIIDKLTTPEELSGLLNWAIEGLKRLDQQRHYSSNKTSEEIKKLWIRKSDSLRAFTMDCIKEDYDSFITKKKFRYVYLLYCRRNKINPCSDKYIKKVLAEKFGVMEGRRSIEDKQEYVWEGIKFKIDENSQDSQGCYGFSTRLGISNSKANVNTPATLTILTNSDDVHIGNEKINQEFMVGSKHLIDDLEKEFGKNWVENKIKIGEFMINPKKKDEVIVI